MIRLRPYGLRMVWMLAALLGLAALVLSAHLMAFGWCFDAQTCVGLTWQR